MTVATPLELCPELVGGTLSWELLSVSSPPYGYHFAEATVFARLTGASPFLCVCVCCVGRFSVFDASRCRVRACACQSEGSHAVPTIAYKEEVHAESVRLTFLKALNVRPCVHTETAKCVRVLPQLVLCVPAFSACMNQ